MRMSRAVLAAGLLAATLPAAAQDPTGGKVRPKHKYVPAGPGMARTIETDEPDSIPHTLAESLALAYSNNPQLTGERAHLRSTDENVPTALAGWRPTIAITGSYGYARGTTAINEGVINPGFSSGVTQNQTAIIEDKRVTGTVQGTITQYLYRGGRTTATTHEAVNSVYAERARLIAEEETVFGDTINAYVGVIEDRQLFQLDKANEQVLGDELRAINDRFKVGELTRTDVAQAEAALAGARLALLLHPIWPIHSR